MCKVTFSLLCDKPSRYCIEYNNGTLHDVLTFELLVGISAILAVVGYIRASSLFRAEEQQIQNDRDIAINEPLDVQADLGYDEAHVDGSDDVGNADNQAGFEDEHAKER